MYVERKMFWTLIVAALVVLGTLGWIVVSLRATTAAAQQAADRAAEATGRCQPCGAVLTRAAVDEVVLPLRTEMGNVLSEARETRDMVTALRTTGSGDDAALAHFLRFSAAYAELLIERLAAKSRVDIAAARVAVEKMFEGHGGKPPGWFWGPVP